MLSSPYPLEYPQNFILVHGSRVPYLVPAWQTTHPHLFSPGRSIGSFNYPTCNDSHSKQCDEALENGRHVLPDSLKRFHLFTTFSPAQHVRNQGVSHRLIMIKGLNTYLRTYDAQPALRTRSVLNV